MKGKLVIIYKIASKLGILVVCLVLQIGIGTANEGSKDTLLWVGNAGVNYKKLEFQRLDLENNNTISAEPYFLTLNLSLTSTYKAFYLSGNVDLPLQDYASNEKNFKITSKETYNFSRMDANITAGYNLFNSVSIFGGYLAGETEIDIEIVELSGNIYKSNDFLKEYGGFFGFNYSLLDTKIGVFSINIAYALLDGKYEFNVTEGPKGMQSGTVAGNSAGLSYGIKYTYTMSASTYFHVVFKTNKYEFKSDNGLINADEDFSILSGGISWVF